MPDFGMIEDNVVSFEIDMIEKKKLHGCVLRIKLNNHPFLY
ncbi:MAG: hypothetical protein WCG98_06740 [bacterium]